MKLPPELPDSPLGRQVSWFLEQVRAGRAPAPAQLVERIDPAVRPYLPPLDRDGGWQALQKVLVPEFLGPLTLHSDSSLELGATDERGRSWLLRCSVDATGRFSELRLERVRDEELTVRWATAEDSPVLSDIERRSPMQIGSSTVSIDRGEDYFGAARLMEDVGVVVAELDGVPVGVHCAAAHRVRVGGTPYRLAYFHHLRILPEHQGKGVFGKMAEKLGERYYPPNVEGTYAYVAPGNAPSQRLFSTATPWRVQPLLCHLHVAQIAGGPAASPASPAASGEIVEVLNACHQDDEFWTPYTLESLTDRLTRAPGQYGWRNLLVDEGAVLGVWPAGESIAVVIDGPDGRRVEREGLALDHGFLPGSDVAFEGLVRAWCADLRRRGLGSLTMFSSERSPNFPVLKRLGAAMEPLDMYVFGPPVPTGAADRGVYVDHVYF